MEETIGLFKIGNSQHFAPRICHGGKQLRPDRCRLPVHLARYEDSACTLLLNQRPSGYRPEFAGQIGVTGLRALDLATRCTWQAAGSQEQHGIYIKNRMLLCQRRTDPNNALHKPRHAITFSFLHYHEVLTLAHLYRENGPGTKSEGAIQMLNCLLNILRVYISSRKNNQILRTASNEELSVQKAAQIPRPQPGGIGLICYLSEKFAGRLAPIAAGHARPT
nr:hypothetical protein [Massilia sp. BJB1822]